MRPVSINDNINDILNNHLDSDLKDAILQNLVIGNAVTKDKIVFGIKGSEGCSEFEKTKDYYRNIRDDTEIGLIVEFRKNYIFVLNKKTDSINPYDRLQLTDRTFLSLVQDIYSVLPQRQRSSHVFKIFKITEKIMKKLDFPV